MHITNFQYRVCARDIIKFKNPKLEPLKVFSSSGIRDTKSIPVYFPAQQHPLFGNQRILNFEAVAVRDITLQSRL